MSTPSPVFTPVPGSWVSLRYGVKRSNYKAGYHTGRDYAADRGANILAVRNGNMQYNGYDDAYGHWGTLEADNGRDYIYCHMIRKPKTGRVTAGEHIGDVGMSGNATGYHLHLEDRPRGGRYGQVRNPDWNYGKPKPKPAPLPPWKWTGLNSFKGAVKAAAFNLNYKSHVAVVQEALGDLGYDIEPTGEKGDATVSALNNFLSNHGWPKSSGHWLTKAQLNKLVIEAEKKKPGTQYPPRA